MLVEISRKPAVKQQMLSFHIQGMVEDGEAIPEPSTLDDVRNDPARKDAALVFLVTIDNVDETIRSNITAPESQTKEIDRVDGSAGMTRSHSSFSQSSANANATEQLSFRLLRNCQQFLQTRQGGSSERDGEYMCSSILVKPPHIVFTFIPSIGSF